MKQLFDLFVLFGSTLRNLSLSGSVGNILAIVIYCLVSFAPVIFFLYLKKKKQNCKADWLLIVLSILLFIMIFYLINPTMFMAGGIAEMPRMGSYMLIGLSLATFVTYLVLRGIEVSAKADVMGLQKGIKSLLYLIILALIGAILLECLVNLPEAIRTLKEGNTMSDSGFAFFDMGPNLEMTIVFLVLESFVKIVPCVLEIVIVVMILRLIQELKTDRYSEKVVSGFEKLGNMCVKTLTLTVLLNVGFCLLQVFCRKYLYQVNMDITIPLLPITLVLAVFLITRYVKETQKMKEELDMFI